MDKHNAYADIAKQRIRPRRPRRDMREELSDRAARYLNYGEALRAFASDLKAPRTRKKLLLVADEFCQKAASMEESMARSRRAAACRRT